MLGWGAPSPVLVYGVGPDVLVLFWLFVVVRGEKPRPWAYLLDTGAISAWALARLMGALAIHAENLQQAVGDWVHLLLFGAVAVLLLWFYTLGAIAVRVSTGETALGASPIRSTRRQTQYRWQSTFHAIVALVLVVILDQLYS